MLPLGWLLAIKLGYGLVGLWVAMSISWIFATIMYLYVVLTTSWEEQADQAKERNQSAMLVANE